MKKKILFFFTFWALPSTHRDILECQVRAGLYAILTHVDRAQADFRDAMIAASISYDKRSMRRLVSSQERLARLHQRLHRAQELAWDVARVAI